MNTTDPKELKKKEVKAVTEKGETLKVKVYKPTWRHRIGLLPKERTFVIKHITAGNLMRISALLLEVDVDLENASFKDGLANMAKHTPAIIEAIAVAIHNEQTEPPKKLIDFLTWNMEQKEIVVALLTVIKLLDVMSFTYTIALMKKASLMNQES